MNERDLVRILGQDLSVGTEAFRDALLTRCLAVLNAGDEAVLDDEQLDLLAAAGDPTSTMPDDLASLLLGQDEF